MRKYILTLILVSCFLVAPAAAAEVIIDGKLVFVINPGEGWVLYTEPPEPLVKEMALHVAHEPAAAQASVAQIESVARKRLTANEAILYHAASGAHLDIDFSATDPGDAAPDVRTLCDSAEYAAQSLEGEADVAAVVRDVAEVELAVLEKSCRLTADYLQHDQPMRFRGYIGYVQGYWVYLYFTVAGTEPALLQEFQSMLERASMRRVSR